MLRPIVKAERAMAAYTAEMTVLSMRTRRRGPLRVDVLGHDETEDAVVARLLDRPTLRDQPVEYTVRGHAVERIGVGRQIGQHFLMGEWTARLEQQRQYTDTPRSHAPRLLLQARAGGFQIRL